MLIDSSFTVATYCSGGQPGLPAIGGGALPAGNVPTSVAAMGFGTHHCSLYDLSAIAKGDGEGPVDRMYDARP
jgi:hypothetical protein